MEGDSLENEGGAETLPEPSAPKLHRNQKMVSVYNASMRGQKIHLGHGKPPIMPGKTGKMPYGVYSKIKHLQWVQSAERGDVPQ